MDDLSLGRAVRALRRRRGWRQEDAAGRAGVHRSTWSLLERGQLDAITLPTLRRCLQVLEVRLTLVAQWRGSALDRLLDEDHSRLQAAWKQRLEGWGWVVVAEVSFNRYGDRGRIDLLAWHPPSRVLLVVEIKTLIADAQGLLGPMDVKTRVAPAVARQRGWASSAVVPLLVLAESSTNRRHLESRAPLFSHLSLRGRGALVWLRRPSGPAAGGTTSERRLGGMLSGPPAGGTPSERPLGLPSGLLVLSDLSPADHRSVKRVGRQRVRRPRPRPSVESAG